LDFNGVVTWILVKAHKPHLLSHDDEVYANTNIDKNICKNIYNILISS